MPAPWGITATGFNRPRLADIISERQAAYKAVFGENINLNPGSNFSQIIGIESEREDLIWQAAEDAYNSEYPDTAFGASLDGVGSITGIPRLPATLSSIQNVKLFGQVGTPIPAGTTQFSVQGSPLNVFKTTSTVTLAAGQNCIQTITFSGVPTVGQWQISDSNGNTTSLLAYNATAAQVQAAIRALPFCSGCVVSGDYTAGFTVLWQGEGTGGLMIQGLLTIPVNTLEAGIALVTVTTTITQAGIDQADVTVIATQTGPVVANAGTLTNIVTPISGLDAVLNTQDAAIGRDVESDNDYRARRAEELQVAGAGTLEAIRSKLLTITGVTAVVMFENVTEIVDPSGHPPHSFEAVVEGGTDSDIANMLWQTKPAGIKTDGSTAVVITDSQGQPHTINFSRPTVVPIYLAPQITTDFNYPVNGDALVAQALVTAGNKLGIGKEVIVSPYLISVLASIPGIQNIELFAGTAPDPLTDNNVLIAPNEIAAFDTIRVNVVHV